MFVCFYWFVCFIGWVVALLVADCFVSDCLVNLFAALFVFCLLICGLTMELLE